jgi:hypothetical protein
MGRRPGSLNRKPIKEKKGKHMHGDLYGLPIWNGYYEAPDSNKVTISDVKSQKHFGILLSTQKSVEEFQEKSGMKKAFTTEYQYHYWALVARIKIEGEVLDIAIPTVLFNYKQEVNGAAVDFHLNDVEEASERNKNTAEIIGNIIVQSSFGEFLRTTFSTALEWMNVPMNTCHVHPGQLSSFSGTDYAKTVNDPGICFPLANPTEQPSFSSIICHQPANGNIGKIVRTEYRNASRDGNVIKYLHGACFSYWRGHTVPGYTIPGSKTKLPVLQAIFSNKEFDEKPEVVVPDIVTPSYGTTDGEVVVEGNDMLGLIIKEFNAIDFSPHTEDILASRIVPMSSRFNKSAYPVYKMQTKKTYKTIIELRELLIKSGYSAQVVHDWDYTTCDEKYAKILAIQELNNPPTSSKQLPSKDDDMSIEDKIKFMLANGISTSDIKGKTILQLDYMFETIIEKMEELEALDTVEIVDLPQENTPEADYKSNEKVMRFLESLGIPLEDLMKLTNQDIECLLVDSQY